MQPGAPGEPARVLTADELARAEHPPHTEADVSFMQGMIVHHLQAVEMASLVAARTTNRDIHLLARRIELSQDDEILLMKRWLENRGESTELPGGHDMSGHGAAGHGGGAHDMSPHEMHGAGHDMDHGDSPMHGMLSPEQMEALAAATGAEFDRLFLEGMIQHHEGAITMVRELFASPGSGQEGDIFTFASHVEADQNIEILRMQGMLAAMRR